MIQDTVQVNSPILITIQNPDGNLQPPAGVVLLKDGVVVVNPVPTVTPVGSLGLFNISFTPMSTGVYTLVAYDKIQARIVVVSKSIYEYLENIEDEAIGSWRWDKTDGTLIMLRQDGTELASFTVVDNLTEASRERTT